MYAAGELRESQTVQCRPLRKWQLLAPEGHKVVTAVDPRRQSTFDQPATFQSTHDRVQGDSGTPRPLTKLQSFTVAGQESEPVLPRGVARHSDDGFSRLHLTVQGHGGTSIQQTYQRGRLVVFQDHMANFPLRVWRTGEADICFAKIAELVSNRRGTREADDRVCLLIVGSVNASGNKTIAIDQAAPEVRIVLQPNDLGRARLVRDDAEPTQRSGDFLPKTHKV